MSSNKTLKSLILLTKLDEIDFNQYAYDISLVRSRLKEKTEEYEQWLEMVHQSYHFQDQFLAEIAESFRSNIQTKISKVRSEVQELNWKVEDLELALLERHREKKMKKRYMEKKEKEEALIDEKDFINELNDLKLGTPIGNGDEKE